MTNIGWGETVVLLPRGEFPGGALLAVVERLREHGVATTIASEAIGRCAGTGAVSVVATARWDDSALTRASAVIVLDDPAETVAQSAAAMQLLRTLDQAGCVVAAVGAGVLALAASGVALGREVVAPDDAAAEILARAGAIPTVGEANLADGRVLTALEPAAGALVDDLVAFRGVREGPRPHQA